MRDQNREIGDLKFRIKLIKQDTKRLAIKIKKQKELAEKLLKDPDGTMRAEIKRLDRIIKKKDREIRVRRQMLDEKIADEAEMIANGKL
jgi:hypothetical protein